MKQYNNGNRLKLHCYLITLTGNQSCVVHIEAAGQYFKNETNIFFFVICQKQVLNQWFLDRGAHNQGAKSRSMLKKEGT